jgi:hypothetical protein
MQHSAQLFELNTPMMSAITQLGDFHHTSACKGATGSKLDTPKSFPPVVVTNKAGVLKVQESIHGTLEFLRTQMEELSHIFDVPKSTKTKSRKVITKNKQRAKQEQVSKTNKDTTKVAAQRGKSKAYTKDTVKRDPQEKAVDKKLNKPKNEPAEHATDWTTGFGGRDAAETLIGLKQVTIPSPGAALQLEFPEDEKDLEMLNRLNTFAEHTFEGGLLGVGPPKNYNPLKKPQPEGKNKNAGKQMAKLERYLDTIYHTVESKFDPSSRDEAATYDCDDASHNIFKTVRAWEKLPQGSLEKRAMKSEVLRILREF